MAVRRPIVAADFRLLARSDLGHGLARHIDEAQSLLSIAPHQLLAVERPDGRVVIGVGAARQLGRLAFAVLGTDIELVFPGRVGIVGDPFPVRRPDGVAFVRIRRPRQVTRRPVFSRDGIQIAARDRDHALPIRRRADRLDMLGRIDQGRAARREIFLDLDWHHGRLPAGQIVAPDVARLFEHDRVLPDRRELDVVILEGRELLGVLAGEIG